jgi:hypothetical protein
MADLTYAPRSGAVTSARLPGLPAQESELEMRVGDDDRATVLDGIVQQSFR